MKSCPVRVTVFHVNGQTDTMKLKIVFVIWMHLNIIKKKYGAKKNAKCGSFVPEVMKKTDNKSFTFFNRAETG
jgi:hypothetical protein